MSAGIVFTALFLMLVLGKVNPQKIGWYIMAALAAVGLWFILSNYQILIVAR